ncbi:MAG: RICIN domain-containing protein [Oscillospiraceae bacterium]|nr:RICIN domain-containing protein [Oscillospiraceae bacterium]
MNRIKSLLAAVMMLAALPVVTPVAASAAGEYDGVYAIRNVNSGKYLNVEGGAAVSGTNVQQWGASTAHKYDSWQVAQTEDGTYKITSLLDDRLVLTVDAGGNVVIATDTGASSQLYELSGNADGSFKLLSAADGKAVEIINAETDSGANAQVWEVNGANCQDWELVPVKQVSGSAETKVTVSGADYTPGDLNADGVVDVFDFALAKRIVLNGTGSDAEKLAADVNANEKNDVTDLVSMSKFLHTGTGSFQKRDVKMTRTYAAIDGSFEKGYVEDTNAGFVSSSYLNLYNELGSDMSLNVEVPTEGIYALTVRQANGGTSDRAVKVAVSGGLGTYTLKGATTGAWTTWEEETIYIHLNAGLNTITLSSMTEDGASNFDTIVLSTTTETESPTTPVSPIMGKVTGASGGKNVYGEGIQMEYLNRGLTAAYTGSGMQLSWRILATDADATSFKLYKNGALLTTVAAGAASNYFDQGGTAADKYTIDTYFGNNCVEKGTAAVVFGTKNSGQSGAYFDINTQKPADQTMPDGTTCTYTENDCSVGDIDGDGVYEIFVKWDPSNSQDNSKDGYTGTTFFDCYRLDGTLVWRIDLGINIRSGAHYTQYLVYDFDGDGKCELIAKTADGTKDGKGNYIGDKSKDYRSSAGRILTGPEYITLFDGATGAALDTQNYDPARGTVGDWGDTYGNRVDRFTACVAYLDGKNASACFGRGYYTRAVVAAWDVKNGKLSKRWTWDSGYNASTPGYGDGNHHCLGADVDGDGKQEVVIGSAVVDDNGKLLYTTSNAHGDAIHIGDFDPSNPGLEIFQCLEDEKHPNGKAVNFGVELRDAKTGKALFRETAGGDTGRALADNLIAGNAGAEMVGSHSGNVYSATGSHEVVCQWSDITKWGQNSVVYWTDVLERAVLDRTMADQYGKGRVFTGDGVTYNNYTKSNACLTADILGDWREEMIFRKSDGGLRVFETTFATEYPIYSLMHNPQYRVQVAAQNNGYNQPPHTDYFLGTGYALPTAPTVFDYTSAN